MRLIDDATRARFSDSALTTCLCWKLKRSDGVIVCLTDHDAIVDWQGMAYEPGAAIEAGRFAQAGGLRPGRAAGAGGFRTDGFCEDDLAAGLWNGAQVSVYRVDWQAPEHGAFLWSGYLSEITSGPDGFEAELISLKADLERTVGRTYSRRCDARLGDARCGLEDVAGQACDKTFAMCRDVFANTENFRGFPHMPGPDALIAGPLTSGNDGGRR